jgi:hypothetical protein
MAAEGRCMIGFLKCGQVLIPLTSVESVDISRLEQGIVDVTYAGGQKAEAREFDAFEAVMLLKPGALEGRRLRWVKNAWAFHNLVAHPMLQILVWLGMTKAGIRLHDATVPRPFAATVPRPFRG